MVVVFVEVTVCDSSEVGTGGVRNLVSEGTEH